MGWESRRGGKIYYYRKRREAGRAISEYVGHGWTADLAAITDAKERHNYALARLNLKELQAAIRRVDRSIDRYHANVRQLAAAVLQQAGFHQHKGQWRKTRTMVDEIAKRAAQAEISEFYELMQTAAKKSAKPADVEKCRKYAQEHQSLFDETTAIASFTMMTILDTTNINAATRIFMTSEVDALGRKLGKETASPLEKLLIDDVTICWLRMQIMEQLYSQNLANSAVSDFLEKRLSATRHRYLRSIEALARVRGLLSRAGVQINIANQQIVTGS